MTTPYYNQPKKKRTCRTVDFAVPADDSKIERKWKKDKYLARELKKLWNMKVMIIPIVIGALGPVTKGLIKGQEDKWKQSKLLHC